MVQLVMMHKVYVYNNHYQFCCRYEHTCSLLDAHKSHILKRLEVLQSHDQSPASVDKQEVNVTAAEMCVVHVFILNTCPPFQFTHTHTLPFFCFIYLPATLDLILYALNFSLYPPCFYPFTACNNLFSFSLWLLECWKPCWWGSRCSATS